MAITWTTYVPSGTSVPTMGCFVSPTKFLFLEDSDNKFKLATINSGSSSFATVVDTGVSKPAAMFGGFAGASFTLLSDGRVLYVGDPSVPNAYLITISGNSISIVQTTSFPYTQYTHATTLLQDGRVVVLGEQNLIQRAVFGTISGDTVSWVSTSQLPAQGCSGGGAITLADGRIFLMATNFNDGSWATANCPCFLGTVSGNTISWVSTNACPGGGHARNTPIVGQASDGKIWAFGGDYYSGGQYPNYTVYSGVVSGNTITWTADTSIGTARNNSIGGVAGNRLFNLSGNGGGEPWSMSSAVAAGGTVHSDSISEPASAAQTSAGAMSTAATRSEAATAAQTSGAAQVLPATHIAGPTAAQTSSASQVLPATQTDAASAAQTSGVIQTSLSTQTDAATAGQTSGAALLFAALQSDAGTLGQTSDASFSLSFDVTLTDTSTPVDANAAQQVSTPSISEAMAATHLSVASAVFIASETEVATSAETSSASKFLTGGGVDSSSLGESASVSYFANAVLTEAAASGQTSTASAIFVDSTSEAGSAAQESIASLLVLVSGSEIVVPDDALSASTELAALLSDISALESIEAGGLFNSVSISEAVSIGGGGSSGPVQYWG